jgi:anti-sigma factor RsiW
MSECIRYAPMLTARPGELTAEEAMGLERHLDACLECRALRGTFLASEGLLAEGLMARANQRDFAPFTDAVMARVGRRHSARGRVFDWVSHHRVRAAISALVPAVVAAALVVYFASSGYEATPHHIFELTTSGNITTVLKTEQGPVVLMDEDDDLDGDSGT